MSERRVLVRDVRWRSGAFQIQAPDDDVEHGGNGCQLHPIEHGWHFRRYRVRLWFVGVHGWSDKKEDGNVKIRKQQNTPLNEKRNLVQKRRKNRKHTVLFTQICNLLRLCRFLDRKRLCLDKD